LNTFLILIQHYSKMLSESSKYEDTEFEDDFDDNLDELEEIED
jgi:hypothetical protein